MNNRKNNQMARDFIVGSKQQESTALGYTRGRPMYLSVQLRTALQKGENIE